MEIWAPYLSLFFWLASISTGYNPSFPFIRGPITPFITGDMAHLVIHSRDFGMEGFQENCRNYFQPATKLIHHSVFWENYGYLPTNFLLYFKETICSKTSSCGIQPLVFGGVVIGKKCTWQFYRSLWITWSLNFTCHISPWSLTARL